MVGVWRADMQDMADMMALQMDADTEALGGWVTLELFEDGDYTLLAEDYKVAVQAEGAPRIEVTVTGHSNGVMEAEGGVFIFHTEEYDLLGSADFMGSVMEIPFTEESGFMGGALGQVTCSDADMRFEEHTDPESTGISRIPRNWQRVE